jgi:hypothetical protein
MSEYKGLVLAEKDTATISKVEVGRCNCSSDLKGDFKVNLSDLILLTLAYASKLGY